jgi:hypothetical protein
MNRDFIHIYSDEDEAISNKKKARLTKIKKGGKKATKTPSTKRQSSRLDEYDTMEGALSDEEAATTSGYQRAGAAKYRSRFDDDDSDADGDVGLPKSMKKKSVDQTTSKDVTLVCKKRLPQLISSYFIIHTNIIFYLTGRLLENSITS